MNTRGTHRRFAQCFTAWVRWLRICAVPDEHIALVLDVTAAELAEYIPTLMYSAAGRTSPRLGEMRLAPRRDAPPEPAA